MVESREKVFERQEFACASSYWRLPGHFPNARTPAIVEKDRSRATKYKKMDQLCSPLYKYRGGTTPNNI